MVSDMGNEEKKFELPSVAPLRGNATDGIQYDPQPSQPSPSPQPVTYDDPEVQKIADKDPETARRINGIMKAQNLEGALASAKEEQDRETNVRKRAANNAKILAMGNLIGNLAKFGAVAGHPNGTDMPYVDISAGAQKQAEAARTREDAARKNYLNIRQRGDVTRASLIQQGYQDADKRKQQAEANKLAAEKLASQNAYNAAKLTAQNEKDAKSYDLSMKKFEQTGAHNAAMEAIARARVSKMGTKGSGNGSTIPLYYNGGSSAYNVPKNVWNINQKKAAWDAIDPKLRAKIIESLAINGQNSDDANTKKETSNAYATTIGGGDSTASSKNLTESMLDLGLATALNGDASLFPKLHEYMKKISGNNVAMSASADEEEDDDILDWTSGNGEENEFDYTKF